MLSGNSGEGSPQNPWNNGQSPPEEHWTLIKDTKFEPSHYSHLFHLHIQLASSMNYITWMKTLESALDMEELLGYVDGCIAKPTDPTQAKRWKKADACVCIILINTMEESVNAQLSHLTSAADIWTKAQ